MSQNLNAGLVALITAEPTISALIANRMYAITLPESPTLPALRYQVAGGSSTPTFDTGGMNRWRYQFDCFGLTQADAFTLRNALIAFLNGWRGVLTDGTNLAALLIQPIDFFESDPRQYRCAVEFYLYFTFN